ncbi:MAG: DUF1858 domain-containing protein [Chloroflexi bacterium]|nr:DUF1858 domain-containing protein [Chloroflexota bacterium]
MAITKEMKIGEIVQKHPQTVKVFFKHGLMCVGCAAARFENLEQGALAHGIDIEAMLKDLNAAVEPENKN